MVIDSHEYIMFPIKMQLEKMAALNKILADSNTKEGNIRRLKKNISEVVEAMKGYPDRLLGFGAVPLGMELEETGEWIDTQITSNSLYGIGEFTPGSGQQIMQLETAFQAMKNTRIYPVWVHTFHLVTMDGIRLLMSLCEKYRYIPVIFGHLGGSNWMDVIIFAKGHDNVYLDLSAAFASIATKMALTELPERCLYRQLIDCKSE